jgi:hypothetical protein
LGCSGCFTGQRRRAARLSAPSSASRASTASVHHEFYGEKNFPHLDTNQKYINQKLFDLVDSVIPFPKEPIRVITPSRFDKELKELYLPSIKKAIEDVPRAFTNLYKGAEIDGE